MCFQDLKLHLIYRDFLYLFRSISSLPSNLNFERALLFLRVWHARLYVGAWALVPHDAMRVKPSHNSQGTWCFENFAREESLPKIFLKIFNFFGLLTR